MKTLRRKAISVTNSRWAAYATAGAATALAGLNSAEADITYSGALNQPFNDTNPAANAGVIDSFGLGAGASFYLLHNLVPSGAGFAGFAIAAINAASFAGVSGASTSYRYPFKLASNLPVSAQVFIPNFGNLFATLAFGNGFALSQWLTAGTGFVGFRFDSGAGVQYGWARLTMDSGVPVHNFTLVDYAYGSPGQSIQTGQTAVPEPGSLGLLAVGAIGLLAWRRSRANAAA